MSAGATPISGQQVLNALVDARAVEACAQGLRDRCRALLQRLEIASNEADSRAREALQQLDVLAMTDPKQLRPDPRFADESWQAIARATQQTCDLEADAARKLDLDRPHRNGTSS